MREIAKVCRKKGAVNFVRCYRTERIARHSYKGRIGTDKSASHQVFLTTVEGSSNFEFSHSVPLILHIRLAAVTSTVCMTNSEFPSPVGVRKPTLNH